MDDRSRSDGTTRIVEVGAKPETARVATAEAWLLTTSETVGAFSGVASSTVTLGSFTLTAGAVSDTTFDGNIGGTGR